MAELQNLVERLEIAVHHLESMSFKFSGCGTPLANGDDGGLVPYVEAFDALLSGSVAEFVKHSKIIGDDVEKHAVMLSAAFQAERHFLLMACKLQQPLQIEMTVLLKPLSDKIQEIQNFREKNRGSKLFNHLSAVSESVAALGWVAVVPKPGPYVKEMNDAATFYTNRVLKEYKDNDKRHVEWVKSFLTIWTQLQAYIKEYHITGLSWNNSGPDASALSPGAPPLGGSCPPPPPPPGPPPAFADDPPQDETSVARSQLFADLNQGEGITRALRHVPDAQKTHKNPNLRSQSGSVNSPSKSHKSSPTSPNSPQQPRTPMLKLEGKKWRVEYQENVGDLVISETELKHVAYVFKCSSSMLQIQGKINSITIDSCHKLSLVFDNVVGIVEIINSRDVQIQVLNKVPTISVNKTEGCHIYLSEESLDCEIVSAKSSEVNILIPHDDDYKEYPIPEQFKTTWDGSKLVTEASEIVG
ncbi:adenylyl cyclase-associated protein 2 [Callorhinchus milii]|nr:adenylyl cyclase-associated protein 2 [Callorhinchus milii]XP_042187723.1 adenylyl cyclase-associated protein 2 [Callorhinchus milii]XP_042187724.1 adenylyl cyclase-associated protein 2 [Callorhinchus milii]|eukprot:gi/632969875/ref/XP_007901331.1/ PREDICTED: adenylyl cyclase-associated protein 2 isoform X2 [Callorhinchus milii]